MVKFAFTFFQICIFVLLTYGKNVKFIITSLLKLSAELKLIQWKSHLRHILLILLGFSVVFLKY